MKIILSETQINRLRGNLSEAGRDFLPFDKAKEFVHLLKIPTYKGWAEYSKSGKKPKEIPSRPQDVYKSDWVGFGDWLGNGKPNQKGLHKIFLPFEQAREYVRNVKLNNRGEWEVWRNSQRPNFIPSDPRKIYKDNGWVGFGDWFGTHRKSAKEISKNFWPFDKAREYAQSLNLHNINDWEKYVKSGKKPENIPSNPHHAYKDSGWVGFGDWLATGTISNINISKQFLPFDEAKSFVRKLNLLTVREWNEYSRTKRPQQIPSAPNGVYKNRGWINWYDWLVGSPYVTDKDFEKEYIPLRKEHRWTSFEVAKDAAKQLGFNTQEQWQNYIKNNRPKGLPYKADEVYSAEWQGWDNFLGLN